MSKLAVEIEIPERWEQNRVRDVVRKVQDAVNDIAEGRARSRYQEASTVPTTGTYAWGDWVFKKNPIEEGTAGSKYVQIGWVCTSAGTPGTLLQMRVLTGN